MESRSEEQGTNGNYALYTPNGCGISFAPTEQVTISVFSSPHFHDEAKAFAFLESVVWANGVACPHCGLVGARVYELAGVRTKPSVKNSNGVGRHGLKKCGECRKQFTVKVGTVFEHARIPLSKILRAVHLIVNSQTGVSSLQLSRALELQYRSARFLVHRINEAIRSGDLALLDQGGGAAKLTRKDVNVFGYTPSKRVMKQ